MYQLYQREKWEPRDAEVCNFAEKNPNLKKTMKNTLLVDSAPERRTQHGKSAPGSAPQVLTPAAASARHVLNLRPAAGSDGTVLVPAGVPVAVHSGGGWRPLLIDAGTLLLANGRKLRAVSAGTATDLCSLPADARGAFVSGDMLVVSTDRGAYLLDRTEDAAGTVTYSAVGIAGALPACSITAVGAGFVEADIDACNTDNVGELCVQAYNELNAKAAAAGAYLQPVMARCRMYDSRGRLLGTTEPVAVMLPEGPQLSGAWTFKVTARKEEVTELDSSVVTAHPYSLVLTVSDTPDNAWARRVSHVEVQVSPQFHTMGAGAARVTVDRTPGSDGHYRVRVVLPGADSGVSATAPVASAWNIEGAAARADALFSTVAVLRGLFDRPGTVSIPAPAAMDAVAEGTALRTALRKGVPTVTPVHARMQAVGTVIARNYATAAGRIAHAGIDVVRPAAPNPVMWATSLGANRWWGDVRIDYANGDVTVDSFSGSNEPVAISPFVSVPAPDAVRLTISIHVHGEEHGQSLTLPLTPDATGAHSVFTAPTPVPMTLAGGDLELDPGEHHVTALSLPTTVAVSTADNPLAVTALLDCGARINTVGAAHTAGGAWDFGRARFWLFTSAGMMVACTNAQTTRLSSTQAYTDIVRSPKCVADAGDCLYVLTANAHILRLQGARATFVTAADAASDRLGWLATDGELVVASTDDNEARHLCTRLGNVSYWTELVTAGSWLSAAGHVYCGSGDDLVDLAETAVAATTAVHWQGVVTANTRQRLDFVKWPVKATRFNGTLAILRRWLTDTAPANLVMARLTVNGIVRTPITCPVRGVGTYDAVLDLQANVSPDFALS